ncbi:alpha/beta fold hydrolase [Reichenbachiella agarivorans]|uniref:Alpha/beta fold hydrolase n=1 Tax=Reichenbachiella agarivorans TaxID=2979464 RepID=A0ABY6CRA0_9BACT|nr:alpha/beta fold hydrolase [Reichenbachiella agarivorans]UXP33037.1 alpha/beta fold hydrolase [Reichenbachiella agarivorans]
MPLISNSTYLRPSWLFSRHLETIVPSTLRRISGPKVKSRVRIETTDDDFLDLDWYKNNADKVLILSHGLEGDSQRPYILGMVNKFFAEGWDVIAWNYRGCSGEPNRQPKFYHSGATSDLHEVVSYVLQQDFKEVALSGFSLGGNLTLKFLGEYEQDARVTAAAVFSVPLDLAGCAREIDKRHNVLYSKRFLKSLKEKVRCKSDLIKDMVDMAKIEQSKSVYEFDNYLTAPIHGFGTADNYYARCSSREFIHGIKIPTLVVNALNDPFLSTSCFDTTNFVTSDDVYFEMPKFGGHVGFSSVGTRGVYWSEQRAFDFISQQIHDR